MKQLQYLNRKDILLEYAYLAIKEQFNSEKEFITWFDNIKTDEKKNTFLKVAPYYLTLVKKGDWHISIPKSDSVISYFTNTYKFISIFSLIESLSKLNHVDFYQYLIQKKLTHNSH